MTKVPRRKVSAWVTDEYAHQVQISARQVGRSDSAYVKFALDAVMSNPKRPRTLIACGVHAELGRLHSRLAARSASTTDDAVIGDIGEHLCRLEALMLSLVEAVHREIGP